MSLSTIWIRFNGVFLMAGFLVFSLFLVGCASKSEEQIRQADSTIEKQRTIINKQNRDLRWMDDQLQGYRQLRDDLIDRIELLENDQNTLVQMLDNVRENLRDSRDLVSTLSVEGQEAREDRARVLDQLNRANDEISESDYRHNEHIEVLSDRINQMRTQRNQEENKARRSNQRNQELRKELSEIKQVNARLEGDKLVISMNSELLFDLGSGDLKSGSNQALNQIAESFAKFPNRPIVVEGHTDTLPIKNSEFQSNWHLSSARAISVVTYFVDRHQIPAKRMAAAGYGEHRPIRSNSTAEGRKQNRRVEIVLYPENLIRINR